MEFCDINKMEISQNVYPLLSLYVDSGLFAITSHGEGGKWVGGPSLLKGH